jgi:acyl-coenzyme A thioesterase PaaI-like protein
VESINCSLFFDYIGFKREADTKEQIILSITVKDHLLSDQQFIASGVFTTMLDIAIGTAITNLTHCPAATIQLNLSFFDLTRRQSFTCKVHLIHKEGNLAWGEGEIFDNKGNLAAKGQGAFNY